MAIGATAPTHLEDDVGQKDPDRVHARDEPVGLAAAVRVPEEGPEECEVGNKVAEDVPRADQEDLHVRHKGAGEALGEPHREEAVGLAEDPEVARRVEHHGSTAP